MAKVYNEKQLATRYNKLALSIHHLHMRSYNFIDHIEEVKEKLIEARTHELNGIERRYFRRVGGSYLNYVIDYELVNEIGNPVAILLREVTVYDTYLEYEADRVKNLKSVAPKDQNGLNYN
jgi:hypothetical protein